MAESSALASLIGKGSGGSSPGADAPTDEDFEEAGLEALERFQKASGNKDKLAALKDLIEIFS